MALLTTTDPTINTSSTSSSRSQWTVVLTCCAIFAALFLYYYPPLPAIEDEIGFYNQASLWSQGRLHADVSEVPSEFAFLPVDGKQTGWRNPGRSLSLIPFFLARRQAEMFWTGCVIHIVTTLILAKIFIREGASPLWSLLYLFHPTTSLYSRTLMSDELGGMFVAATILVMLSHINRGVLAGVLLGAAILCRYQIAAVVPFAAWAIYRESQPEHQLRNAVRFVATLAVVGVILASYNWYTLGSPLGPTHQGNFSLRYVPKHLAFYVIAFSLLWPGLLPVAMISRSGFVKTLCLSFSLPLLSLLICYYFHDTGANFAQTLILGQRLATPLLPGLLIVYGLSLDRRVSALRPTLRKVVAASLAVGIVAGIGATAMSFAAHQRYLDRSLRTRTLIAERIPAGATVYGDHLFRKLFGYPSPDFPAYRIINDPRSIADFSANADLLGVWYIVDCRDKVALKPVDERILRRYAIETNEIEAAGVHVTLRKLTRTVAAEGARDSADRPGR